MTPATSSSLSNTSLPPDILGDMELTDLDVQNFRESWKQDFGEDLSPDRARSEALRLLDFFATLEAAHRPALEERERSLNDDTTT